MTTQTTGRSDQPVSERAAEVGGAAREETGHLAETAKDQAMDVGHEAISQARDLIGELRQQVRQQGDAQRQKIADALREFGDELDRMAQAGGGSGTATEVVRQIAARTHALRGYLEGGPDLMDDLRSFARRRPGAFLLGAAVAGVLAGRATRGASAARRRDAAIGSGADDNDWRDDSWRDDSWGEARGLPQSGLRSATQSGRYAQPGQYVEGVQYTQGYATPSVPHAVREADEEFDRTDSPASAGTGTATASPMAVPPVAGVQTTATPFVVEPAATGPAPTGEERPGDVWSEEEQRR